MYQNMTKCSANINQTCLVSLTDKESSEISKCFSVMKEFTKSTAICLERPANCSCWTVIVGSIKEVQGCRTVAFDNEKKVKKLTRKCLDTFGVCKKLEDKTLGYISECKTSRNALEQTLASLRTAQTFLENVNKTIDSLINSSINANGIKRQGVTIVTTISSLVALITSTSSVDSLGTNSDFLSTTSTIIQVGSVVISTVEITQIKTYQQTISGVIQTIIIRITQVITMLTDLGGNISPSPVAPVPAVALQPPTVIPVAVAPTPGIKITQL